MILRRITEHVKAQNWTAIAIDFLIVVFGVFIGSNVTNWNAARHDHERSVIFTERLRNDLRAENTYALALGRYFADVVKAGETAYDGLTGARDIDDRAILIGAFRATQTNWYERRRAAFDELVATSSLDLIKEEKLRELAIYYYNTPLFTAMQSISATDPYRDIFAELIEPRLRRELHDKCGDRDYGERNGAIGLLEIGYPCEIAVSDAEAKAAIDALRGDPELLRALRLKLARISSVIYDLDISIKSSGSSSYFEGDTAK